MIRPDKLRILQERSPAAAAAFERAAEPLTSSIAAVLASSDFVLDALARDPSLCASLLERAEQRLAGALPLPALPSVAQQADATQAEAEWMAALRRWRRAEFTRIAWRDLAGWASLDETLSELSQAADAALQRSQQFAFEALARQHGVPRSPGGAIQQLIIVAMGKLGGRELNFSSDIDLVLLYAEGGETDGARPISNQEFFTRLAQGLVRLLAQRTEEGFVFRIDLRLRPHGESGPVVSNALALEHYLQIHGRDWERYAWVKARPITDDESWLPLYRSLIRPFVYRRYLDFGVFESLREMKALIEREVHRRDLADDIKLGDGGIREIEFIVQSFQLIRGGQDRRLQDSSLRRALPLLAGAKLLPAEVVGELDAAYVFLRRLENRLQMRSDQQLHRLPSAAHEREPLAESMGYDSWSALAGVLEGHRGRVAEHFRALLGARGGVSAETVPAALPLDEPSAPALEARLRACGFADAGAAARLLGEFAQSAAIRRLDQIGSRRLTELLPVLVAEAADTHEPLSTLRRLLRLLEAIGARSAYLALLLQQSGARRRLVQLTAHGDFLTEQIAAHPLLLDELIDERILEQPPDRAAMAAELTDRMAGADPDDEEQLVEQLRYFQRAVLFRLALADLFARLPLMVLSDRLTDLAELIVERALALTWRQLTPKLGTPMCSDGGARRAVRIAVIGYGKLGGRELGYASDLDLVFVHDSTGAQQETEGARSIDNQVFFVRFAQRLVHLLSMHSAAGRLYAVDVRLRPSGKGGMLISHIEAFADYQRRDAWTYEHQALLHARAVAGAPELCERFEAIRLDVLAHSVRRERLRDEVRDMRARMRRERSHAKPGQFDLKQDWGGIADIEFLAQYWALKWAQAHPPVVMYSDTIRQLESLASADLVPQATVDTLTGAYRAYRARLHHRALEGLGEVIADAQFIAERAAVRAVWDQVMESASAADGAAGEAAGEAAAGEAAAGDAAAGREDAATNGPL